MIARYNNLSLLFGVPGIVLQIVGNIMYQSAQHPAAASAPASSSGSLGALIAVGGTVLLMIGLMYYAKAKGRHPAWCLMAFLSLIGLIVLACLKDKSGVSA